ncbi:hypothetical protein FNV43_RR04944 [Rhamnella rubrinervis]|uniref:Uncharacterized protein n=1 Tax=Rhamnella rubrinervis TaxID=2594499 RepID=A0A8K0HL70_9ROSA|nr:hypothetical protein FNV43_RR04944 [Rhamnella rubrinervis]
MNYVILRIGYAIACSELWGENLPVSTTCDFVLAFSSIAQPISVRPSPCHILRLADLPEGCSNAFSEWYGRGPFLGYTHPWSQILFRFLPLGSRCPREWSPSSWSFPGGPNLSAATFIQSALPGKSPSLHSNQPVPSIVRAALKASNRLPIDPRVRRSFVGVLEWIAPTLHAGELIYTLIDHRVLLR